MRARWLVVGSVSLVALRSIQACGGDDSNDAAVVDGGTDAAKDATKDATGEASVTTPRPDASSDAAVDADAEVDAADADLDAGSDADADLDAGSDAGADADAEVDAAPPAAERVSPALCVDGLGLGASTLYWAENIVGGCTAAVRSCSTSGCATLPSPSYTAATGSLPIGVAVVPGSPDAVFFTDNQFQHAGLWKMQGDGGALTDWGNVTQNGSGVTTDGTDVFWVGNPGVYRSSVASAGSTKVLDGASSITPQGVAVDATNVYAWFAGKVLACPKGTECTTGGATTPTLIANATSVQDIVSDGTSVFFTAAPIGHIQLYRCPIAGCAAGTPELLSDTVTAGASEQFGSGLAVAANDVYWGSTNGTIYVCSKTEAAPCTPKAWVTGAGPIAFVQDATYLYWTDTRGGVYRVAKR